jgi:antitoxin component of MazEF toxin-antitoxin module
MESVTKAKKIGGSIAVIIPKEIVERERIFVDDSLKIKIEKTDNLNTLWGRLKDVKKPTDRIMKEIDEAELDG